MCTVNNLSLTDQIRRCLFVFIWTIFGYLIPFESITMRMSWFMPLHSLFGNVQLATDIVEGARRLARKREFGFVCLSVRNRILIGWCRPIIQPGLWWWVELRLLWFSGMLRSAIHDEFLKVSRENIILLVKSHHHAKNQEWRGETENMRELTKRTKTEPINQSTVVKQRKDKWTVACGWLIDWLSVLLIRACFLFRLSTLESWYGVEIWPAEWDSHLFSMAMNYSHRSELIYRACLDRYIEDNTSKKR